MFLSPRRIKIILACAGIGVLVFFGINYRVAEKYSDLIYRDITTIESREVALVLGAGLRPNGEPSEALGDRVKTAVELYQNQKVKKILMSGDNGSMNYNEVQAMKDLAVALGVPAGDVTLDYAGFRTYDSCYRAREIFLVSQAIIVSQEFHLARALYLCNELGVDSIGMTADRQQYAKIEKWKIREIAARVSAWFELNWWAHEPKFLGKEEGIRD